VAACTVSQSVAGRPQGRLAHFEPVTEVSARHVAGSPTTKRMYINKTATRRRTSRRRSRRPWVNKYRDLVTEAGAKVLDTRCVASAVTGPTRSQAPRRHHTCQLKPSGDASRWRPWQAGHAAERGMLIRYLTVKQDGPLPAPAVPAAKRSALESLKSSQQHLHHFWSKSQASPNWIACFGL